MYATNDIDDIIAALSVIPDIDKQRIYGVVIGAGLMARQQSQEDQYDNQ